MTGVEIFFITKAILGIGSLAMLIFYMSYVWDDESDLPGRKMRYTTLLWFTLTIVVASARQATSQVDEVHLEQWFVTFGLLFLFITMIISIKDTRKTFKR